MIIQGLAVTSGSYRTFKVKLHGGCIVGGTVTRDTNETSVEFGGLDPGCNYTVEYAATCEAEKNVEISEYVIVDAVFSTGRHSGFLRRFRAVVLPQFSLSSFQMVRIV